MIFQIPDYRNAVIVAKTPASAKKAQSYAERLRLGIAVIHGEPQDFDSDREDGRHSPPPQAEDDRQSGVEGYKTNAWSLSTAPPGEVLVSTCFTHLCSC